MLIELSITVNYSHLLYHSLPTFLGGCPAHFTQSVQDQMLKEQTCN